MSCPCNRGSRGIGRAIALRLAEDGADVVVNYQNTKEHAQKVSRLIDQMGTVDELEELKTRIVRMDGNEKAKEFTGKSFRGRRHCGLPGIAGRGLHYRSGDRYKRGVIHLIVKKLK